MSNKTYCSISFPNTSIEKLNSFLPGQKGQCFTAEHDTDVFDRIGPGTIIDVVDSDEIAQDILLNVKCLTFVLARDIEPLNLMPQKLSGSFDELFDLYRQAIDPNLSPESLCCVISYEKI